MRCNRPQYRYIDGEKVYFPCGHCEACLRNRRSEKALRGYLESLSHDKNCFLTLTYSDDTVPHNDNGLMTLRKSHLDDYIKRVRSYYGTSIRILGSGEYSPEGRPHYHVCVFGLSVDDFVERTNHFHSNSHGVVLEDYQGWNYGGILACPFDVKTSFYVSKYLVKSNKRKEDYEALNIEPEFIWQSRRPALGKQYVLDNKYRLIKDGFIRCKGVKFKLPRYFLDTLLKLDYELLDEYDPFEILKEKLSDYANKQFKKYKEELSRQFVGKNIYKQIHEEQAFREKILGKENR